MEMRHLRCFVAVAKELHFGRAAQRLHLSQPPVSQALKELEDELGVRLLERTSRRIALTPIGEDLLNDALSILAGADLMRKRGRDAASGLVGSLSIGFISLPTLTFLPALLKTFDSTFPQVKLSLLEGTTDQLTHDVESGHLDLALVFQQPDLPPTLQSRPVQRDPLVVALPQDHPEARHAQVSLKQLKNEKFLCFERRFGPLMFDAIVASCMKNGFSPQVFTARQMHTIVSMVSGGLGVALVPECLRALGREGVVYRPIQGARPAVSTVAVWRAADRSPVLAAMVDRLPTANGRATT